MYRHSCIILMALVCGLGAATTTQRSPATSNSVDPSESYRRAIELMAQAKFVEAQALLQQADRAFGRMGKVTDLKQAGIVYASGVCAMTQKDYTKAHQQFERVRVIKGSDRSFLLNDAKVDLAISTLHGVGLKALDVYLNAHSLEPDEEAIDLFGGGIDRAIRSGMNAKSMTWATDDYVKFNSQLERTRPNMHHWGQEWFEEARFAGIEDKKRAAQRSVDDAQARLNDAQSHLAHISANYDAEAKQIASEQSTRRTYNKNYQQSRTVVANPDAGRANPYEGSLREAKDAVSRRSSELAVARDSSPKPTWSVNLEPILPGEVAAAPMPGNEAPTEIAAAKPDVLSDLLTKMTGEIGPSEGAPWTKLHTGLAQQWLSKNVKGKAVRFTGNYVTGAIGNDGGIIIVCTLDRLVTGGLTISTTKFTCRLAESESANAAKLVAGHAATAVGTVDEIVCKDASASDQQVGLELHLSEVNLQAEEKKK